MPTGQKRSKVGDKVYGTALQHGVQKAANRFTRSTRERIVPHLQAKAVAYARRLNRELPDEIRPSLQKLWQYQQSLKLPSPRRVFGALLPEVLVQVCEFSAKVYEGCEWRLIRQCTDSILKFVLGVVEPSSCKHCGRPIFWGAYCDKNCSPMNTGYKRRRVKFSNGQIITVQSKGEQLFARKVISKGWKIAVPDFAIQYRLHDKEHLYHPDFVVKVEDVSVKTYVVEVKSHFTLVADWDKNLAKVRAANRYCEQNGMTYVMCVLGKTANRRSHVVKCFPTPKASELWMTI